MACFETFAVNTFEPAHCSLFDVESTAGASCALLQACAGAMFATQRLGSAGRHWTAVRTPLGKQLLLTEGLIFLPAPHRTRAPSHRPGAF